MLPPGVTVWEAGVAERAKSGLAGAAQARMALLTFNRPPVTVTPERDGMASTLLRRSVFRLAVLSAHLDSTSRAAPETCGVAMDVPLRYA